MLHTTQQQLLSTTSITEGQRRETWALGYQITTSSITIQFVDVTHLHNTSHKSEFKLHENDQKLDENIFSPPPLPRITRVKTLQLSSVILQDNLKIHSLYRPAHRNLLLLFLCYLKIISPQIFFIFRIHNIAKVAAIAKLLYDSHSHGVLL